MADDLGLIRKLLEDAALDAASTRVRKELCAALAVGFSTVGRHLWIGGSIIGPDRVAGRSPFRFGSDATVGLGIVAQIAGELSSGTMSLLEADNSYAACALIRQLVEVEYLAWAFSNDEQESAGWLRSSREARLRIWQPKHIRDRSGGRFRSADYGRHCDVGGHPTPAAATLLPDHSARTPASWWWVELAIHGTSTWEYLREATHDIRYGYREEFDAVEQEHSIGEAIDAWRAGDRLAVVARRAIQAEPDGAI